MYQRRWLLISYKITVQPPLAAVGVAVDRALLLLLLRVHVPVAKHNSSRSSSRNKAVNRSKVPRREGKRGVISEWSRVNWWERKSAKQIRVKVSESALRVASFLCRHRHRIDNALQVNLVIVLVLQLLQYLTPMKLPCLHHLRKIFPQVHKP